MGGSGNTFYLLTTLANYAAGPSNVETITMTVVAATCDCNKARWTVPSVATIIQNVSTSNVGYIFNALSSVAASVNTDSTSPTADSVEMRSCQNGSFCSFTHTYVIRLKGGGSLPAFITSVSGKTATIAPTLKTQMGVYTIEVV